MSIQRISVPAIALVAVSALSAACDKKPDPNASGGSASASASASGSAAALPPAAGAVAVDPEIEKRVRDIVIDFELLL